MHKFKHNMMSSMDTKYKEQQQSVKLATNWENTNIANNPE